MRTWPPHASRYCFFAGLFFTVALLFLVSACGFAGGSSPRPTPTLRLGMECSDKDRRAVSQVPAPRVPVPGHPGCTAQLQVLPDQDRYDRDDLITVIARFTVQGDCALKSRSTYYYFEYYPIQILNQSGEAVPLNRQ